MANYNDILNVVNNMPTSTAQANNTFINENTSDLNEYISNLTENRSAESEELFNSIQQQYEGNYNSQVNFNIDDAIAQQNAIFEGKAQLTNSAKKLPSQILESIISQPLNINPNIYSDTSIDALGQRVKAADTFNRINEAIENKDKEVVSQKKKIQDEYTNNTLYNSQASIPTPAAQVSSTIDYALIKSIVKECLSEINTSNNNHCGIMLSTESNFKFCDNDGNIYECQMVYKGKKKNKK